MEEKKRNIRIDQDGTRHAPVPMWQELPQITESDKQAGIPRFVWIGERSEA